MARLLAPDGTPIVSTLENLTGTCGINEAMAITRNPDGTFDFDYDGGTDIDWDSQSTVVRDGQRVFVDEDGGEWLESELSLEETTDA